MLNSVEMCRKIGQKIAEKGGKCYYVGGCVRDEILGRPVKDIDIEVHLVTPRVLREALCELGEVNEFGVSFGIFNLRGYDIDIAMPRLETCTGRGHRDFDVYVDPYLGEEKAALRRDFTVNALMKEVLTGEVLDFFGGIEDLKNGVIRHVNEKSFGEDPLRVLRACQFAARFNFKIDESTVELCKNIDITALAGERIYGELIKALKGAQKPSIFFEELRRMNKLSPWFFELERLIDVPQPPLHHPEGDVWNHTMMVLDKAAELRNLAKEPLNYMFAALCHDFGKPDTTKEIDGRIRALGHEIEGTPHIKSFLNRISVGNDLKKYVLNMTELHMRPNILASSGSKQKSFNKVYDKSICPEDLILLSKADHQGRGMDSNYEETEEILRERLGVFYEIMEKPYVMGRDLIDAGLKPDQNFSKLLERAHLLRLSGVTKEVALGEVLSYSRELEGPKD